MTRHNSHFGRKGWIKSLSGRLAVPPLSESLADISPWFDTPLGQDLITIETKMLESVLNNLFGYHFMQISSSCSADFSHLSRINHTFKVLPSAKKAPNDGFSMASDLDLLPFENEQIDVTLLHHVLEFSDNPHQVLKEAARVTVPRGYVVIVGFNPMSLNGLLHFGSKLIGRKGVFKRHSLNRRRMKDWLEFLDFSCVERHCVGYNLPINKASYLGYTRFINDWLGARRLPFGMSYCLLARKDKAGLTPIKPKWGTSALIESVPVPKQAIKVQNSRSALVLPFRLKNK